MATRKSAPKNGHAFTVVLEQLRGDFRVFGEALAGFREAVDRRFDRVEGDIQFLKTAVTEHTRLLKDQGRQLNDHGRQLEGHGRQLEEHGRVLAEHGRELRQIRSILEEKVDRDELRPR
jgi:hypothetical protein